MQSKFQELTEKNKTGLVTLLLGLLIIAMAFALAGPIIGAGASPLAPILLVAGGLIASSGLVLIARKTH